MELLTKREVTDFIDKHAAILDNSIAETGMSDAMRERLKRSNWVFSGLKTFHELNEAFPSLLDEKGNKKPLERFLNDVRKIDDTYNRNYLRAEYNFAGAAAEMAGKWEEFAENEEDTYLQYRTAHDDKVRPEHALLNGITLPLTDRFWDYYYPPNGWNCRCNVVEVLRFKNTPTPHDRAMQLAQEVFRNDKNGMFRFNPGRELRTFPAYNPYTISRCQSCDIADNTTTLARQVPDNELCAACKIIQYINQEKREKKERNRALYNKLIEDKNYKDVFLDEESGGVKATHIRHNLNDKKGWYEICAQNVGCAYGHAVILEAEQHDIHKRKNCEGFWNNLSFEVAGAESAAPNNVRNALKHCASKSAQIAVLFFPNNFSIENFQAGLAKYNGLKGTPQYAEFELIYCIQGDEIVLIKKPR